MPAFNRGQLVSASNDKPIVEAIVDPLHASSYAAMRITLGMRSSNTFAFAGPSFEDFQFVNPQRTAKGNDGYMNWGAGFLRAQNKPMITLGNFAKSGDRTDQFADGVARAIATGARFLVLGNPTNNVGQSWPTTGTVVTRAVTDTKRYIKQANDAGMTVIYNWMRGADSFTDTHTGWMNDINRILADYLAYGDDFRGPPNVVVLDFRAALVNSVTGKLKYTDDGTHDNVKAARIAGQVFAKVVGPLLREYPGFRLGNIRQSAYGSTGLLPNPGLGGTGGSVLAGNTGSLPNSINGECTGTASAVFSIEAVPADADGNTWVNRIKIVASGGASGGDVSVVGFLDQSKIQVGDLIRTGWEMDAAAGAVGLRTVSMTTEWYPTSGVVNPYPIDMTYGGYGLDEGGYTGFCLSPEPLLITPFQGAPYANTRTTLSLNPNGSATVYLYKSMAERIPAA